MKKRWQFLTGILASVVIVSLGAAYTQVGRVSSRDVPLAERQPSVDQPAKPITLLEAWDIASARARQWDARAGIGRLTSVDHPTDTNANPAPGVDGRRRAWQVVLVSLSADKEVWLTIWDGVAINETDQPAGSGLKQFQVRPTLDSPKALVIAQATRPDLAADNTNNHGYRFSLAQGAAANTTLVVTGLHNGNAATVELDANSGAFLSAHEKSWSNIGGVLYSPDSGQTWRASNLVGKVVSDVYPDPSSANGGYAAAVDGNGIAIYRSGNGGATWSIVGHLPSQAGDWPRGLRVVKTHEGIRLIAGTFLGTWISEDGKSWSQVSNLPQGQGQWFAVIQAGDRYRVFASITSGDAPGLYTSDDLVNWKVQAKGVYRLSESYDKTSVLATDATNQSTKALRFTLDTADQIDVPMDALDSAGDFRDSKPSLLRIGGGISAFAGSRMTQNFKANIASISARADFGATGIAVAGGFRAGIYRTMDGGQTWTEVLHNPSDVVLGTAEIWAIRFFSQSSVVAINGGTLTWKEY